LPLKRLAYIWINPLNSAGWPVRTGWTTGLPSAENLFDKVIAYPLSALVKGSSAAYRAGLLVAGILALIFARPWLSSVTSVLLFASLGHVLFRSAFLGWGFFVESRYLLQLFPMLEMTLVFCAFEIFQAKHRRRPEPDRD
jgi:hypothetical protein